MTDGLDQYKRDPMSWAVETVIEGNVDKAGRSAEDLVDCVWEFIVACFEEQALPLPSRGEVVERVRKRLRP